MLCNILFSFGSIYGAVEGFFDSFVGVDVLSGQDFSFLINFQFADATVLSVEGFAENTLLFFENFRIIYTQSFFDSRIIFAEGLQ